MIQAFVGLVGGGKSFCSVRRMMSYMASGGRVASNILLTGYDESTHDLSEKSPVLDYLRSIGWEYQPKQYTYIPFDDMVSDPQWFKRIPAGFSRDRRTLCVVDEATDLFDSLDGGRLRSDSGYRELFHFLRLSRHAHIDILFVCQDLNTINSRLKALSSSIWRSTDMRHFRIGIFKFGFPFDVFLLQLFDKSGKNQIQREFVRKDKRIFGLYQSEAFGGCLGVKWDGVAIDREKGKVKNKGIKKMTLPWKVVFILLVVCEVFLLYDRFKPVSVDDLPEPQIPFGGAPLSRDEMTNYVNLAVSRCWSYIATNSLPKVEIEDKKKQSPTKQFFRGNYNFHQCGNLKWIEFEGDTFRLGMPTEFGRVTLIDEHFTIIVDELGNQCYLLPGIDAPDTPPAVSLQGAGRYRGAASRLNLVNNRLMGQQKND